MVIIHSAKIAGIGNVIYREEMESDAEIVRYRHIKN
jgi:hypothetical protein